MGLRRSSNRYADAKKPAGHFHENKADLGRAFPPIGAFARGLTYFLDCSRRRSRFGIRNNRDPQAAELRSHRRAAVSEKFPLGPIANMGRLVLCWHRVDMAELLRSAPNRIAAKLLAWRRYLVAGVGFEPTTFRL